MSHAYRLINIFMGFFEPKKEKDLPSYFDYSSEQKKKLIDKATRGAMEIQNDVIKEYNKKFLKNGEEKHFYRA